MTTLSQPNGGAIQKSAQYVPPSRVTLLLRYIKRNTGIPLGLGIITFLTLFTIHGLLTLDPGRAYPLAVRTKQPPAFVKFLCEQSIIGCDATEGAVLAASAAASSAAPASGGIGALPGIGGPAPADIGALPGIGGPPAGAAPADIGALPGIGGPPASGAATAPPAAVTGSTGSQFYLLGTDWYGRDLHTAIVVGLWQSALIGVFAGLIATIIPVILGFLAAYFGGLWDRVITGICSVLQPIPPFLIQVVLAASLPRAELFSDDKPFQTIAIIGGIVAITAWMKPTLVIRSQVLSMKERMFVNVAKLSGMGSADIIFKELLPNLLPFIVAGFVNAIFDALFISFGLSVLGLAPLREPLLGNIIYFSQLQSAIFNGWWWWPLWPVLALVMIFTALTLINTGLDEVSNPRARRSE